MRYNMHLYLVLCNCTQVHLQCTWEVPKYISQNLVLVLVLEHFECTCTCTQVLSRCTCPNPVMWYECSHIGLHRYIYEHNIHQEHLFHAHVHIREYVNAALAEQYNLSLNDFQNTLGPIGKNCHG